jgi:SPP1 family predicted phage head-tail adaptor
MWASIRPMKGYEKFQTGQLDTPGLSKVRIRYRAGVTTKHRFLFGTRVLTIKEVINVDEQDDWLDITTIEKQ